MVGRPDFILVNDDIAGNYQSFYASSLDSLGLVYDVWGQSQSGSIPQEELELYPYVIWYTGNDSTAVLDSTEQVRIETYLNGGGRLLLSSQNAGDVLQGTAFYQNVLHAQHLANSVGLNFPLHGVDGDPISNGTLLMPLGAGGASNAYSCASFDPLAPAVGIYTYNTAGTFGALRFESELYKFVYAAFPIEALSALPGMTTRTQFLDLCLTYLQGFGGVDPNSPSTPIPQSMEISRISPNPFNSAAQIQFGLPWNDWAKVVIYDLQGRWIAEIAAANWPAGRHAVAWDAAGLSSGLYLVTIESRGKTAAAKALLLK
jgi:hypothetical protein